MATHTSVKDDLDGTEGAITRTFQIGSDKYEIDLSERNYQKLKDAVAPFTGAARHSVNKLAKIEELRENARNRTNAQD
jgi:hypothetical protein